MNLDKIYAEIAEQIIAEKRKEKAEAIRKTARLSKIYADLAKNLVIRQAFSAGPELSR